ncbi:putative phage holin [Streptosporangium sp. G12]
MTQLIGNILIIMSAVFGISSAALYGACFPWWASSLGRHLFSYQLVIGAALGLWAGRVIALGVWIGPPEPGSWPWIRVGVFAAIAWVLGHRLVKIVQAWRKQRREA